MLTEPLLALPQLRMFYGVALERSFSGAAARLGRTQSAVSHAIRTLEDAIGVRLVDRRGRSVRLTPEGERLFATCRAVYTMLDETGEALRQAGARMRRQVRLGAPPEFGCGVLMRLIAPFVRVNRDIDLDFRLSHDLLTPLLKDEIDLAIDCFEHEGADLEVETLFRETYMVVCAPAFRREWRPRAPADLADVPVLSLDKAGQWWQRFLRALPEDRRPRFGRVVVANHVRAMITAAEEGIGVALVPSYSVRTEVERGVLVRLYSSIDLPEDRFRLYQKKSTASLDSHRRLLAYFRGIEPAEFGLERTA